MSSAQGGFKKEVENVARPPAYEETVGAGDGDGDGGAG